MKNLFKSKASLVAAFLGIIFILTLVPLLVISFYNHPSFDDYDFGSSVYQALQNGGGLLDIFRAIKQTAVTFYYGWQGTFTAIALFTLQPGVFSDDLYFLTTFILLGSLIGSTGFFLYTFLVTWLKQPKSHFVIVAVMTLLLQIHFLPFANEAFFWFNGASFYTLFHSLALVLFGFLIRMILTEKSRTRILLSVITVPLAFFIGGGNYSTCLFMACALVILTLVLFWKKHPSAVYVLAALVAFAGAFAFSVMAPGNAARSVNFEGMNPVEAIYNSILMGLFHAGGWTTMAELLAIILVTPLLMKAAEDCSWSFRYPLLAIIAAFGFFACMITPSMYAMGTEGGARQMNMYYYNYILMLLFDVFYLSGWLVKKHPEVISSRPLFALAKTYVVPVFFVFTLLYIGSFLSTEATFKIAVRDLTTGVAQEYDKVISAQIEEMKNTDGPCVFTEPVPNVSSFMHYGLNEDPRNWANEAIAGYFGCGDVIYTPVETE